MRPWIIVTLLVLLAFLAVAGVPGCVYKSPGTLHESTTARLSDEQAILREQFVRDVDHLATEIGPRNAADSLQGVLEAERWIIERLRADGIPSRRDEVDINIATVANIEVTIPGTTRPEEVIVIGGHYDTVAHSPGANDNASGVALLLALATELTRNPPERTIRVLFFVNEEDPFSFGIQMGSRVYAERCRANGDNIVAMMSVDSVGYYSNERGSQNYPGLIGWSFPSRGNYLAFSSDLENRPLLDLVVATYQEESRFPSLGVAMDSPMVARSDHAPFWWQGYAAVAVSDTCEFRDSTYHSPADTPAHLHYDDMARMATGFMRMVRSLSSTKNRLFPVLESP